MAKDIPIGKISAELIKKDPGNHTVAEQGKEQLKDYIPNLIEATEKAKKEKPNQDFYIVVLTKRERLMSNVFRHYFFSRFSCPTPTYDQAVYFYSHLKDDLEFIWVIPDPKTCRHFMKNALSIPPEEKCLLDYVIQFEQGKLDELARKRNGEVVKQINPIINIKENHDTRSYESRNGSTK